MRKRYDLPREDPGGTADLLKETKTLSNFIMPLTVFLVVAVFISLILIMGFMDLRRLDKALVEFMENRGLDIVTTMENVAQEDLDFLRRTLQEDHRGLGFSPVARSDKEYHIQERLVNALVEVARNIDSHWQKDELTEKVLEELAFREKLSLIVILDDKGRIVLQSREFERDALAAPPVATGDQEQLLVELFKTLGPLAEMGYIALHRKDGSGTIVIALDAGKLKYWGTKIAVKKVIGEIGWEQELAYLAVADPDGNILGQVGDQPGNTLLQADLLTRDILTGHRGVTSSKQGSEGNHYLEMLAPLRLDDTIAGYARLGLKWERARGILAENRNRMILTTIFIVLIGILSTAALYRNQSRQLARMDEMKRRLQRAEQLSALGRLAAGVAHEIRNPLNAISIATQRLQREYAPSDEEEKGEFQRISTIVRDEIRRLNGIIEEFVTFFRIRRVKLHPHPPEDVLQKILKIMEPELSDRNIRVTTSWKNGNTPIPMDSDKMTQALYNILKNAMESITGPGMITVTVEPRSGNQVAITITDTGSGLSPDEMDLIFNPEYTTKEKGLGLGLMLAHEIIDGHRGEIHVVSRKGTGTTFEIILPVDQPTAPASPIEDAAP